MDNKKDRRRDRLAWMNGEEIPPIPKGCPYLTKAVTLHDAIILTIDGNGRLIQNNHAGSWRTIAGCIAAEYNQRLYDELYRSLKNSPNDQTLIKAKMSEQAKIGIAWRRWMVAR